MDEIKPEGGARIYPCESWDQFIQQVRKVPAIRREKNGNETWHTGGNVIFRGHSNPDWLLSSTMERNTVFPPGKIASSTDADGNKIKISSLRQFNGIEWYDNECQELFNRFRIFANGMPNIDVTGSDAELWALGRHYGLLSPYLDWTSSPYVAAFFAFEEIYKQFEYAKTSYMTIHEGGMVHVWGLRLFDVLDGDEEFSITPAYESHTSRSRAQQAWFTLLRSNESIDLQSHLESKGQAYCLERYDLKTEMAMTALSDLHKMNINYLTLFPDVFGAALHANTAHKFLLSSDFKLPE